MGRPERKPRAPQSPTPGFPDLVQGPHRHSAHVVGHVLPAGALWVAGRDPLAVPQVPWGEKGVLAKGPPQALPAVEPRVLGVTSGPTKPSSLTTEVQAVASLCPHTS